jgi:eukaryotic-like serine/threonine-protein kinase
MAEIFLARAVGPRDVARYVVLKRLLSHVEEEAGKIDALVREARVTSRLAHPNLCAITDFGDDEGTFFLVMEWVRGPSLREVIDRAGQAGGLPIDIGARLFAWLGNALHHAHTATGESGQPLGIVHRDVTPENILVGWNGVPKIIDFGIAKSDSDPTKTADGTIKGKLAYISPEQYRGERPDGRSDVFALALCAYEAFTGTGPLYQRESEFETLGAIVMGADAPRASEIRGELPEALDDVIAQGLTKDRVDRPSAAEFARRFERDLALRGVSVGEADVARWLTQLFPEAWAEPALDRTPLEVRPSKRRRREHLSGLELLAEAELDGDALEASAKRGRVGVVLALVMVCIAAIAVVAWVAFGRPGVP